MDIGTAKPDAATLAEFPASPDRPDQPRPKPTRRPASAPTRWRRWPRSRARPGAAARRRHHALLQGAARRPGRAAAGRPGHACRRSTAKPPPAAGRRCTPNWPRSTRQRPRACTHRCAAHPARARSLSSQRPAAVGADRRGEKQSAALPLPVDRPAAVRPQRPAPAHRRTLRRHARRRAGSRSRDGCASATAARAELPSMRCVGYRQVWEVQDGLLPRSELRDRGIYATRQLAKRQITWLRQHPAPADRRLPASTRRRVGSTKLAENRPLINRRAPSDARVAAAGVRRKGAGRQG
jgi:tRNA dimethylallyltransferase